MLVVPFFWLRISWIILGQASKAPDFFCLNSVWTHWRGRQLPMFNKGFDGEAFLRGGL